VIRTGHLFAGAGGGLYADLILGHVPVFAVEQDRHAADALRQRTSEGWFPGLHLHHGDVRVFDASCWEGRVDSIHAGFPCQDISVAGNGEGIDGARSGLWGEVKRIAGEVRPGELFLENSPAIVSRGLGRLLGDLAELGYDAEWCVLSASAVGAPHLRARWWCLAKMSDTDGVRELQSEGRQQDQWGRFGDVGGKMAYTNGDGMQGVQQGDVDSPEWEEPGERQTGSQSDGNGWWAVEPSVGRVVNGLANRGNRIKALGNGQVPLQAAAAYLILDSRFRR